MNQMRMCANTSLLVVIVTVLAGCHSELVVRVDRVLNAPEGRQLQEDSKYGRKVLKGIRGLRDFRAALLDARHRMESPLEEASRPADEAADGANAAVSVRNQKQEAAEASAKKLAEAERKLADPNNRRNRGQLEEAVAQARRQAEDDKKALQKAKQTAEDAKKRYYIAMAKKVVLSVILTPALNELGKRQEQIDKLIEELAGYFDLPDATGLAPRVNWDLLRASWTVTETTQWLDSFARDIRATSVADVVGRVSQDIEERFAQIPKQDLEKLRSEMKDLVTETPVTETLELINAQAEELATTIDEELATTVDEGSDVSSAIARATFGGFESVGVFEISPADPVYRQILTDESVQLSCGSLTRAQVAALGDSSIMVVQETPGHFRVYQVSNDPTRVMKNVATLVNKAISAAAKYLSGGLAP